jgi:hypothetical protein
MIRKLNIYLSRSVCFYPYNKIGLIFLMTTPEWCEDKKFLIGEYVEHHNMLHEVINFRSLETMFLDINKQKEELWEITLKNVDLVNNKELEFL